MTNKYKNAFAAIVLTLALGACGGSSGSEPTATVTETLGSNSEPAGEDLGMVALEITWEDLTETERTDLCYGWELIPETSLDIFMENAGDDLVTRSQAKGFFDTKCEGY